MGEKETQAKEILSRYNQQHIIKWLRKIPKEKKEELIEQILSIDFEELQELYESTKKEIEIDVSELEPIEALNPARLPKEVFDEYVEMGEEIVKNEKLAVVILAGGQRN